MLALTSLRPVPLSEAWIWGALQVVPPTWNGSPLAKCFSGSSLTGVTGKLCLNLREGMFSFIVGQRLTSHGETGSEIRERGEPEPTCSPGETLRWAEWMGCLTLLTLGSGLTAIRSPDFEGLALSVLREPWGSRPCWHGRAFLAQE